MAAHGCRHKKQSLDQRGSSIAVGTITVVVHARKNVIGHRRTRLEGWNGRDGSAVVLQVAASTDGVDRHRHRLRMRQRRRPPGANGSRGASHVQV